ncbi:MAG TPA: YceI family protein [Candidatus Omnitrophota bacterium]|nr:YceI family protein [Candidatus Omnitrophota bacterium]
MKRWMISPALFLAFALSSAPVSAATYKVDTDHSTVSFKIRHILSNTQGTFRQFEGVFDFEPGKPDTWKASGVIQAGSIDTNVPERDKHLRSADFFDVEKFPVLDFTMTKVLESTDTTAKVEGTLTLHGVEKPIVLDVEIHGVAKDPWGNTRASFTATTTINRKDFGLTWNKALEAGQLLVGEEVKITLEIEGILAE